MPVAIDARETVPYSYNKRMATCALENEATVRQPGAVWAPLHQRIFTPPPPVPLRFPYPYIPTCSSPLAATIHRCYTSTTTSPPRLCLVPNNAPKNQAEVLTSESLLVAATDENKEMLLNLFAEIGPSGSTNFEEVS